MKSKVVNIEELKDLIDTQIWEHECSGFKIKDEVLYNCEYIVEDLHVEIEDGQVLFYDSEGVLFDSVLTLILLEALIKIEHSRISGNLHEVLHFAKGDVYIDSLAS